MYVCLCNAVTESQVQDAINEGACTLDQLRDTLQVSNCCGACEPAVAECLGRSRQAQQPRTAPARIHTRP